MNTLEKHAAIRRTVEACMRAVLAEAEAWRVRQIFEGASSRLTEIERHPNALQDFRDGMDLQRVLDRWRRRR